MAAPEKGWRKQLTNLKQILQNKAIAGALWACAILPVFYLIFREIRSISPKRNFPAMKSNTMSVKGTKPRHFEAGAGRQRAFDYQKFYSDMMLQVSTRNYTGVMVEQTEELVDQPIEGNPPAPHNLELTGDSKETAAELIARQKDFIEEQRRLIIQQTKLIEERSKLIEEKNQLLAKQSEMMENHLL